MSTVTTTAADAKRAYAQKVITAAQAKGITGTVVVLPEFVEENGQWVPTMDTVIPGSKEGFGYVQLMSSQITIGKGWVNESELWAIQRGRINTLSRVFTAGTVLAGKIVKEDTLVAPNAAKPDQDLKFLNKDCQAESAPCAVNGQPIYQIKYYTTDDSVQDITIQHDNDAALRAIITAAAGQKNNAQAGIRKVKPTV